MDPLQLLENLSAKDAVEDVVNNRLHGLSNDDRARVLVARGLSIVQVLSRAANQDQFRLACELLKRETVLLHATVTKEDNAVQAKNSFLRFYRHHNMFKGNSTVLEMQRAAWTSNLKPFSQYIDLWQGGWSIWRHDNAQSAYSDDWWIGMELIAEDTTTPTAPRLTSQASKPGSSPSAEVTADRINSVTAVGTSPSSSHLLNKAATPVPPSSTGNTKPFSHSAPSSQKESIKSPTKSQPQEASSVPKDVSTPGSGLAGAPTNETQPDAESHVQDDSAAHPTEATPQANQAALQPGPPNGSAAGEGAARRPPSTETQDHTAELSLGRLMSALFRSVLQGSGFMGEAGLEVLRNLLSDVLRSQLDDLRADVVESMERMWNDLDSLRADYDQRHAESEAYHTELLARNYELVRRCEAMKTEMSRVLDSQKSSHVVQMGLIDDVRAALRRAPGRGHDDGKLKTSPAEAESPSSSSRPQATTGSDGEHRLASSGPCGGVGTQPSQRDPPRSDSQHGHGGAVEVQGSPLDSFVAEAHMQVDPVSSRSGRLPKHQPAAPHGISSTAVPATPHGVDTPRPSGQGLKRISERPVMEGGEPARKIPRRGNAKD